MCLVGLTGGIASGKSTVSTMLKNLGCEIIDADEIARQVVLPGQPAWKQIVKHFGKGILFPNGEINRDELGKLVFADPGKRRVLNSCTHPAIHKVMFWKIVKRFFQGYRFVILDIPLLFESGLIAPFMSEIIVVYCDSDIQLRRLVERNGYTVEHAEERISAQMALNEKCQWATHVVNNSNTKEETLEQVVKIFKELKMSRAYLHVRIVVGAVLCGLILLGYLFLSWIWECTHTTAT